MRKLLILTAFLLGFGGCSDVMSTIPIPPQAVRTGVGAAGEIEEMRIVIHFTEFQPGGVFTGFVASHLREIGLRSVLPKSVDKKDRSSSALSSAIRVSACHEGQADLNWVRTLRFNIKKADSDEEGAEIATYTRLELDKSKDKICGIFPSFDSSVNLTSFTPDFDLIITLSGETPSQPDVELGGFVTIGL